MILACLDDLLGRVEPLAQQSAVLMSPKRLGDTMVSTHESDTDGGVASDVGLFEATDAEDNASDAGGNAGLQCSGQRFGCRPLKRLPSAPPASTSLFDSCGAQAAKHDF